jgi:hypothetical protein
VKVRVTLVVRNSKGIDVVDEQEFSGENLMERVMVVADGLIKSWVTRDKMPFVSLTIVSHG